MMRLAAPLFTHARLFDVLAKALGENLPTVFNSDGDDIVFHEVRFPLEKGVTGKDIAERFAGIDDLRQENPQFWNWLGRRPPEGAARSGNANGLVLMVNPTERAKRGIELLQNVLGQMVRAPLTSIQTIEQANEVHKGRKATADDIPLDVATPLVHAMLDKQYRATLDEPVGMLGDKSPRAAARTKAGREKVAEWLKHLELRSSSGVDPDDPIATYDFSWMWHELKVEELRR